MSEVKRPRTKTAWFNENYLIENTLWEAAYRATEADAYMDHCESVAWDERQEAIKCRDRIRELEAERDEWKHWKMKASQAAERLEAENRELREQCLKWSGMYRGLLDEIKALEEDTHE